MNRISYPMADLICVLDSVKLYLVSKAPNAGYI